MGADVVGTLILNPPHHGKGGFGAEFLVARGMTARAGDRRGLGGSFAEQVGQGGCTGAMHALADEHLDRLQVEAPVLAAVGQDLLDKRTYFAGDFLLDGFQRFFSCSDGRSGSEGRWWQICALTSGNSLCRAWYLRNSSISRSAFRTAAALAMQLVSQPDVGAVTRGIGLMAAAIGLAATAGSGSDGTAAQVGEGGDLIGDLPAFLFEGFEGFRQHHKGGLHNLAYHIRTDFRPQKRNQAGHHF